MNWEAVQAIADVVAAAAVIVTLGYLAVQIRQNTRAIRGATLNAITQHMQYENRWSAEIGASFRKALHHPEEMDEDDAWQMGEWLTAAFVARQNEYSQFAQGLLTERDWRNSKKIIGIMLGAEWTRDWWATYGREPFSDEFVGEVDRIVAAGTFDSSGVLRKVAELGKPDPPPIEVPGI